ncbi:MAG: LCP family protein [Lachnospiraceae bacterium]|nr:LCP family protein [Lachnospiraceae bacterium]
MDQDYKKYNYDKGDVLPKGHSRKRKIEEEFSDIPEAPSRARTQTEKKTGSVLLRRIIIFSILEVMAICGIFVYSYASKQYAKIQRPSVSQKAIKNVNLSNEEIEEIDRGYWNIAVFGVDSRNSSVGKGANSDVIIIVSINRDTGEINLCSVYRDTYLKVGDEKYNKINSAYCTGGPEQALIALNENLDLNITQYVTFNWKAVATGINILGGVDIDISKAEFAYINGFITETVKGTGIGSTQLQHAGMNHLDGVQAVAYARLRLMDNDYSRTERQRKIIKQCFEKAQGASLQTLNDLLGNMLSMVATNLTWQDGLDAIAEISKYSIAESTGFPFARAEANMGKCGACVIPQTLESNVRDLHELLFAQEGYDPSEQVKNISNYISAKSGYYNEGKKAAPASTEGYLPASIKEEGSQSSSVSAEGETNADGENQDGENQNKEREKEFLKKGDMLEYAISKDGYLIYVSGRDEKGNKTYSYYLDSYGKRIKMIDYDEDGNPIYLYELDEDGNFYLDGDEFPDDRDDGKKTEKETDEEGRILPGQGEDTDIYGPGGGPESETKKSSEPTAPGEDIPEEEYPGGPGGKSEKTDDQGTPGASEKPGNSEKPGPSDKPSPEKPDSPEQEYPGGPGGAEEEVPAAPGQ